MIRKLPDTVISRIAAGEVITSPSNIIKELIENSIDSGASAITVQLDPSMLALSVDDNGSGIASSDLANLCKNHCTSKLSTLDQLKHCGVVNALFTFGFRGEALHSVSIVSDVTVTTRLKNTEQANNPEIATGDTDLTHAELAHKANYNGDTLVQVSLVARDTHGTLIDVKNIFHNNTIRRVHFHKNKTEMANCVDLIKSYGCIHSGIEMKIGNKVVVYKDTTDKQVLYITGGCGQSTGALGLYNANSDHSRDGDDSGAEASDSAIHNKIQYLGSAFLISDAERSCLEYVLEDDFLVICSNSNLSLKKCRFILFINNRLVRNSTLKKKIQQIYKGYIADGGHPVVYIEIKVGSIDVNVHPSKSEVLVGDESIFERVIKAVERMRNKGRRMYLGEGGTVADADEKADELAENFVNESEYLSSSAYITDRADSSVILSSYNTAGPGAISSSDAMVWDGQLPAESSLSLSGSRHGWTNDLAYPNDPIKIYSSYDTRTLEEVATKRHRPVKLFSLHSVQQIKSEIKEIDSDFFRALVYIGQHENMLFAQSHSNLIAMDRVCFLKEAVFGTLAYNFGGLERRQVHPCPVSIDESLWEMLDEYFSIKIEAGNVVEAPVVYGICSESWESFSVVKTTEYQTIKSVIEEISNIYKNEPLDFKSFNLIKAAVIGTDALIANCRVVVALKDLYRKFGRC